MSNRNKKKNIKKRKSNNSTKKVINNKTKNANINITKSQNNIKTTINNNTNKSKNRTVNVAIKNENNTDNNKDKKTIIIIGTLLILLIVTSLVLFLIPKVEIVLNGNRMINVSVGDKYIEKGGKAFLKGFLSNEQIDLRISGNVDTSKPGRYLVSYKANNHIFSGSYVRIVNVIDDKSPEVTINDTIKYCEFNQLISLSAKSIDNVDGDISDNVKYKIDGNKVYVSSTDSSGNETELIRELLYIDKEKPIIKIKGDKITYAILNSKYEDEGASASDSCDGNLTNRIKTINEVDTSTKGTYYVTYSVKDSYKNSVEETRTVIVVTQEEYDKIKNKVVGGGTIYLTFDDGPGGYTENILNTLDKYGVKATFFVTNQFPKYQNLIKEEYNRGHLIAIHTYSHKYKTMYSSVDAYLDDFNRMFDIVVAQTGVEPKYFRFPGGTSNRVSNVKMSELARIMTEKGFTYYDWDVDSGDSHGKKATKEYIINMIKKQITGNGEYIVLMHDMQKNTMLALPEILEYGLSNGYTFKVIDDNTPKKQFKPYK